MRIVHVITRMILGGAQENTLLTVQGLAERGHEVILVTGPAIGPEGQLEDAARGAGIPVVMVPSLRREIDPIRDLAAGLDLIRVLRRIRADVVHTHSSKAGVLGRGAARLVRTPLVVHTIHGLPFHPYQSPWVRRLYVTLERVSARWCHALVTVARAMTDQALASGVGHPGLYETVYSGMEVKPFLEAGGIQEPSDWVRSLGVDSGDRVVTTVARLAPLKGHEDLLEIGERVGSNRPRVKFLFVGGGVLEAELRSRAQALGIADRVIFAGLTPAGRIPEILAASDLVVHPSYREGLARVLPQAIMTGVPVVAYDLDGAGEVIEEGVSGSLVPAGDRNLLAERIIDYLGRPRDQIRLDSSVRQRLAARFRAEAMVDQLERLYIERLGERSTRAFQVANEQSIWAMSA